MANKSYSDKLKDPRWQKLRLEVFERDNWKCQVCGDNENTLHVHHKYYENNKEPWEYDIKTLATLCEYHHEDEYNNRKNMEYLLLDVLKRAGLFTDDINELVGNMEHLEELNLSNRDIVNYIRGLRYKKFYKPIINFINKCDNNPYIYDDYDLKIIKIKKSKSGKNKKHKA